MAVAAAGLDHAAEGYERLHDDNVKLKYDMGQAMAALERIQQDNSDLRNVQTDLSNAYNRLKEQHERMRLQLRREQESRVQLLDEHEREVSELRMQLDMRTHEVEDLRSRSVVAPSDLNALKVQLDEEFQRAEDFQQRERVLEEQLSAEQRRAHHEHELLRAEAEHRERELREEMAEEASLRSEREQHLEQQVSALEAELRRQGKQQHTSDEAASHSRAKLQELEAKSAGLQQALEEHEQQSNRERQAIAEKLKKKDEEIRSLHKRNYDLQAKVDQEERKTTKLALERDEITREKRRLDSQVEQAEAHARAAEQQRSQEAEQGKAELSRVRATLASEKERAAAAAKDAEDRHKAATSALRRADARAIEIEEEKAELESKLLLEAENKDREHFAELSSLRTKVETAEKEVDRQRQRAIDREASLAREAEDVAADTKSLSEELTESQKERASLQRQLREMQETQRWQVERQKLPIDERPEKELERVKAENAQHVAHAETCNAKLRKQEQKCDALQVELAKLGAKLESERADWAREAEVRDEVMVRDEEKRRTLAVQRLQDEHRRQLAKLQAASKKALQKASRKRHEHKQRLEALVKRVEQLRHEKAALVRLCEDNKSAYEVRLSELCHSVGGSTALNPGFLAGSYRSGLLGLSINSGCGANAAVDVTSSGGGLYFGAETPRASGVSTSRDLRAIADRLEQHAELVRSRSGGIGATLVSTTSDSPVHAGSHGAGSGAGAASAAPAAQR